MSFKSFVGFPANELNLIVLKSEKLLGKDLRRFLPLDIYWLAASAVMARLSVDSKIGCRLAGWLAGRFWAKVMPLRDPTCKFNLQDFSWAEIPKLGPSVAIS